MEDRYDFLLARVGQTLSSHANLPKLLTYIVLFSDEEIVTIPEVPQRDKEKIRRIQNDMVGMLQGYLYANFPRAKADNIQRNLLSCLQDLRELTTIKKRRELAPDLLPK